MKKIFLALVLMSVILFAGCSKQNGGTSIKDAPVDEQKLDSIEKEVDTDTVKEDNTQANEIDESSLETISQPDISDSELNSLDKDLSEDLESVDDIIDDSDLTI